MSFATSINCIDGRVQLPITDFIKNRCRVEYVDVITMPGCDKVLAEMKDDDALNMIRQSVEISIAKHGSKFVFVSGHDDCAANSGDREKHIGQIRKALSLISSWNLDVKVIGLWLGCDYQVEEIT